MTQSKIILKLLENQPNKWFYSYELVKVSTKYGYIGLAGDRRARELAEKNIIDVRHNGKYAEFRHRGQPKVESKYTIEHIKQLNLI